MHQAVKHLLALEQTPGSAARSQALKPSSLGFTFLHKQGKAVSPGPLQEQCSVAAGISAGLTAALEQRLLWLHCSVPKALHSTDLSEVLGECWAGPTLLCPGD